MTALEVLAQTLAVEFPKDAAAVLERLSVAETVALLSQMAPATAAPIVCAMAPSIAREILAALSSDVAAGIADQMPTAWAAARLRGIEPGLREAVLSNMGAAEGRETRRALRYPAGSIGALSEPEPVSVAEEVSADFALGQVRKNPSAEQVFVVDRDARLVGLVPIGALVAAAPDTRLANIMIKKFDALEANEDVAALVARLGWANVRALPVLDKEGRLVGIVSHDAIQHLALSKPASPANMISLPVSLAELFWLGLVGMTDGLARTVSQDDPSDS